MIGYDLVRINEFSLKLMSELDIKAEDARFLELYEYYVNMRRLRRSRKETVAFLAGEFGISESTVNRVVRRFSQEVRI